jgi:hypothetical protein
MAWVTLRTQYLSPSLSVIELTITGMACGNFDGSYDNFVSLPPIQTKRGNKSRQRMWTALKRPFQGWEPRTSFNCTDTRFDSGSPASADFRPRIPALESFEQTSKEALVF